MTRLEILQKTELNIFTTDDLMVLWQVLERRDVIESVKDYIRRERIFPIKRGLYSLSKEFEIKELAQKLVSPSYISYFTALAIYGIIFQKYADIHCFAEYSKKLIVNGQTYVYHKMKKEILYNQHGIKSQGSYTIASPERAICDSLFLSKKIAFDNLRNIDIDELESLSKIYQNKRLELDVQKLIKQIKEE